MSKTLGNSPDPLDLIARFSADALRFGVIRSAPLGQDVLFDEQQVELGRNFCNKLWNACRFRQMQGGETEGEIRAEFLRDEDRWILIKLDRAIAEITDSLEEYCFNEAAQALYRFFWSEFCDWYLECSKAILSGADATRKSATLAVMDFLLSNVLRLFHPFLPFITEELWMGMGFNLDLPSEQGGSTISFAPWPKRFDSDFRAHYGLRDEIERIVGEKFELVSLARNLRRERNIAASRKLEFILRREAPLSDSDIPMLKQLLNAADIRAQLDYVAPRGTAAIRNVWGELFLPMAGLVDSDAERSRLVKELTRIQAEIDKVSEKLRNPEFLQRVPESVLRDHQSRLDDWRGKLEQVKAAMAELA
jgi:valyl-tRNA synthetase